MRKMIVLLKRKAGMSKEQFLDYYENHHLILASQHFGDLIADHARYYPAELATFPDEWVGMIPQSGIEDYDAISVYTYKDEASGAEYGRRMADVDLSRQLIEDELRFLDRSACRFGYCDVVQGPGML